MRRTQVQEKGTGLGVKEDLQDVGNDSYGPAVDCFAVRLLSEDFRSCGHRGGMSSGPSVKPSGSR